MCIIRTLFTLHGFYVRFMRYSNRNLSCLLVYIDINVSVRRENSNLKQLLAFRL